MDSCTLSYQAYHLWSDAELPTSTVVVVVVVVGSTFEAKRHSQCADAKPRTRHGSSQVSGAATVVWPLITGIPAALATTAGTARYRLWILTVNKAAPTAGVVA
jgi:hypothetical protein